MTNSLEKKIPYLDCFRRTNFFALKTLFIAERGASPTQLRNLDRKGGGARRNGEVGGG